MSGTVDIHVLLAAAYISSLSHNAASHCCTHDSELNVESESFSRGLALLRSKAIIEDVRQKCVENSIDPEEVLLSSAEMAETELPKAAVKVQQALRAKGVDYKFKAF